jgi:hypothetical protein
MLPRVYRFACVSAVLLLGLALGPARADDVESVRQKLFEAKKAYDGETQKFRKASADWFDKREEEARVSGNKKLVDQVKAERAAFEKDGETPQAFPVALHAQMRVARDTLDKAYGVAIKDYVRLKADAAAEATEKEQQKLVVESALAFGKRTYVGSLRATNVKVWNNWFEKDVNKYKMDGEAVPHSIFMHPDVRAAAQASFTLTGKPIVFRATVGIPKHEEVQGDSASPLTFEVLGDGVSLWKSKPVAKLDTYETCVVKVEKVKTLTLRVHCPDAHGGAHAVWFAPIVVE